MTALNFTSYKDPSIFITLEQHFDLPKSTIKFASKRVEVTTQYGGRNESSTQIVGEEYEPIVLTGVWQDRQSGDFGRAERLARAFEALAARAELIVLEWGSYQRWGTLAFEADYTRRDKVNFTITFNVKYDQPPSFTRIAPYGAAPNDQASEATDQVVELRAAVEEAPSSTTTSLLLELLTLVASIENDLADALSILEGVAFAQELGADVAARAARSLYSPILALKQLRGRSKAATLSTISTVQGVAAVDVRRWLDNVDLIALGLNVTIAGLVLDLVESVRPPADRPYVVRDNETLMTIAANVYGDFSVWTKIADANLLESPLVAAGTTIFLPNEV